MRLLLVEDELKLVQFLRNGLRVPSEPGCIPQIWNNPSQASFLCQTRRPAHRADRKGVLPLSLLARHPGQILSRTMIAEQVWDMNFDCGSNVDDVVIRRHRAKVDERFSEKLIRSYRGRGHCIEPPE